MRGVHGSTLAFSALVAITLATSGGYAYQLHTGQSMCRFQGNGTCFDLSTVMDWPVHVSHPSLTGQQPAVYEYWFDPCKPLHSQCTEAQGVRGENRTKPDGGDPGIALCQKADQYYNAGLLEPFALWNGQYPGSSLPGDKARVDIYYGYGSAWRNVHLVLQETDSPNTTFTMDGEAPSMQYNFRIEGKNALGRVQVYPC